MLAIAVSGCVTLTAWVLTRSDALAEAVEAQARGNPVLAVRRALDYLDRRPWSREAALVAARNLSRLDFAAEAEPYYARAGLAALSPEDLHGRAYGLVRSNRREEAIRAYEDILARHPDDLLALRRLAAVQITRKDLGAMNRLADRLIRLPDGAALGYTLRGIAAQEDNNFQVAADAFREVLRVDPDLSSKTIPRALFWNYLGRNLIDSGRVAEGRAVLERELAREPDAELWSTLGRARELEGSTDEAERCFRKALELSPGLAFALVRLGKIELARRHAEQAVDLLQRAVAAAPDDLDVNNTLAMAYRQLNRPAEAEPYARKVEAVRARIEATRFVPAAPRPSYTL